MFKKDPSAPNTSLFTDLNLKKLATLLNRESCVDTQGLAQQVHRSSFLFHFRPLFYPQTSLKFLHTFYLGFLLVLLLFIEVITGLALMIYYVPTPDGAYGSILRLITEVPFGNLIRNIHRLCGELMILVAVLHMVRVLLTASFNGKRRFTWFSGVVMFCSALGMAFTGYLLPWDQLAYWAVTIGTSMAESLPLIGDKLNIFLRGSEEIGADGLLRFYVLHISILPLCCFLLLGIHYYRISRIHGISKPRTSEIAEENGKVGFLPTVLIKEILLTCFTLLIIVIVAQFWYQAPLANHADPTQTPWNAQAPWFFLWLQGLLKTGDKTITGIVLPLVILFVLALFPYWVNRKPFRFLLNKPISIGLLIGAVGGIGLFSYMGTHFYGFELAPQIQLVNRFVPAEEKGVIDTVPYDQLKSGVYHTQQKNPDHIPEAFDSFLRTLRLSMIHYENGNSFTDSSAVVIVEEWQHQLKRLTLRIQWLDKSNPEAQQVFSIQQIIHLHEHRIQ